MHVDVQNRCTKYWHGRLKRCIRHNRECTGQMVHSNLGNSQGLPSNLSHTTITNLSIVNDEALAGATAPWNVLRTQRS